MFGKERERGAEWNRKAGWNYRITVETHWPGVGRWKESVGKLKRNGEGLVEAVADDATGGQEIEKG